MGHLRPYYLTVRSSQNPYWNVDVDSDEIAYSYLGDTFTYQLRRFHWQPGLTPEQLELYQTLRADGTPIEQAATTTRILIPDPKKNSTNGKPRSRKLWRR